MTPIEALEALREGKEVEYLSIDDVWRRLYTVSNIDLLLDPNHEFRIKTQEIVTVGDISFPKPITELPEDTVEIYVPDFYYDSPYCTFSVHEENIERFIERGVAHLTPKDAIAHAKAIIKLSGGNCE